VARRAAAVADPVTTPTTETPPAPVKGGKGKGGLGKKLGPLPVWGWALIVAGGVAAWVYYKRKQSGTATSAGQAGQTCTDSNGNPGVTDAEGNCITATTETAASGPGSPCTDASGNAGVIGPDGQTCDTSGAGTGTPGGGGDAALMAQIKALQGAQSKEAKTLRDLQTDVGEPKSKPTDHDKKPDRDKPRHRDVDHRGVRPRNPPVRRTR
jgi:hypothetical protein